MAGSCCISCGKSDTAAHIFCIIFIDIPINAVLKTGI